MAEEKRMANLSNILISEINKEGKEQQQTQPTPQPIVNNIESVTADVNENVNTSVTSDVKGEQTPPQTPSIPNVIDFCDVTLKFGDFTLFDKLNFSIPDFANEGQFISIIGKSGSGKSQIARLISGLRQATDGKVKIYNVDVTDKTSVPMVFQQYSSYPWMNIVDNVAFPMRLKGVKKKERRAKAMELLKLVGLEGHEYKWTYELSGGQLQRVSLARNLATGSQIMILDEATSALDLFSKRDMQQALLDVYYKSELDPTIINITHDISEAVMLSNRIIVLRSNPSEIYKTIDIKFDGPRTQEIRNTPQFAEYVKMIEGIMNEVAKV